MTPSLPALRVLVAAATLVVTGTTLHAADRVLGQPRLLDNGDIQLSDDVRLGRRQGGKTILQPDSLQIQGTGSTGPVDGMSVGGATLGSFLPIYAPAGGTYYFPEFSGRSANLQAVGAAGAKLMFSANGSVSGLGQAFGSTPQWQWDWNLGKALTLTRFTSGGGVRGHPVLRRAALHGCLQQCGAGQAVGGTWCERPSQYERGGLAPRHGPDHQLFQRQEHWSLRRCGHAVQLQQHRQ